jgi:hypothetical protein
MCSPWEANTWEEVRKEVRMALAALRGEGPSYDCVDEAIAALSRLDLLADEELEDARRQDEEMAEQDAEVPEFELGGEG